MLPNAARQPIRVQDAPEKPIGKKFKKLFRGKMLKIDPAQKAISQMKMLTKQHV